MVQHDEIPVRLIARTAQVVRAGQPRLSGPPATTTSTSRTRLLFIFPLTAEGEIPSRRCAYEDGAMTDTFRTHVLDVRTGSSETVYDLTRDCEAFLREAAA
ncbi:hypothetical protein GCM10020000_09910 [Streptomyces olivoverticillatus]